MPIARKDLEKSNLRSTSAIEELGIPLQLDEYFYLPEIYRHGLGIKLNKDKKTKVLSLLRQSWSRAGV